PGRPPDGRGPRGRARLPRPDPAGAGRDRGARPAGGAAVTRDPYNAFLHREEAEGDWRVGVKDVIDVAGMPTTAASRILDRLPERDREARARRQGGAHSV